jgi:hypothetical protein
MEKLEIEKTKPTFIISVLKVDYYVVLVSSISNFFTNKTSLANKWMSFISSNLALDCKFFWSTGKPPAFQTFDQLQWSVAWLYCVI